MRRTKIAAFTLWFLALAAPAHAIPSFSLLWRDTGTTDLTVLAGDVPAGGQRQLDLILESDIPFVAFGVTVGRLRVLPPAPFLSLSIWDPPDFPDTVTIPRLLELQAGSAINPLLIPYAEAYNFSVFQPDTFPPYNSFAPGTYHIGTLTIDTSAATQDSRFDALYDPRLDGMVIDDANVLTLVTAASFQNATLHVLVPEPTTGSLAGLGLLALGAIGRRRRS